MARPVFDHADFLDAALVLVAERGPSAATIAAVTERLRAPTGSFYHRFPSRDALLGELWLKSVLAFQQGIEVALTAGDGLAAALHTPIWVREHLDEGCLLLLYHRDDFVQGDWPQKLQQEVAAHTRRARGSLENFARNTFGSDGPDEIRRAQFVLAEVPVAAVRQHLRRREPPPPIVDDLIRAAYLAVIGANANSRTKQRAIAKAESSRLKIRGGR
jgi:AcrR family transcriptional regulator